MNQEIKNINILVVDDDEGVCDSLSKILKIKGYNVGSAYSGKQAIKALCESDYQILLTDLKMPEMNGIELLKKAKEMVPGISAIIMTGFGEVTSYIEAMDVGADEYLNKPIKSEELELIINKLVSGLKSKSAGGEEA